jgi:hypothetical protein
MGTIKSQTMIAQMTALDTQVQERFNRFNNLPIQEMYRWFSQEPATAIALETLDFKQQWLEWLPVGICHGAIYGTSVGHFRTS